MQVKELFNILQLNDNENINISNDSKDNKQSIYNINNYSKLENDIRTIKSIKYNIAKNEYIIIAYTNKFSLQVKYKNKTYDDLYFNNYLDASCTLQSYINSANNIELINIYKNSDIVATYKFKNNKVVSIERKEN